MECYESSKFYLSNGRKHKPVENTALAKINGVERQGLMSEKSEVIEVHRNYEKVL